MKMIKNTLLLSLALFSVTNLIASDVEASLELASEQYRDGQFAQVLTTLSEVMNEVSEEASRKLITFLPTLSDDWKRSEPDIQSSGLGVLGMGSSVSVNYTSDEGDVEVTITANSPIVAMLKQYVENPMFLEMSGMKTIDLHDHTAIVKYEEASMEGTIQVVVGETGLVAANGSNISFDDLKSLMEGVRYDELLEYLNQ